MPARLRCFGIVGPLGVDAAADQTKATSDAKDCSGSRISFRCAARRSRRSLQVVCGVWWLRRQPGKLLLHDAGAVPGVGLRRWRFLQTEPLVRRPAGRDPGGWRRGAAPGPPRQAESAAIKASPTLQAGHPRSFPWQRPRLLWGRPSRRGRSSMVERKLPKLHTRVRFPSPAPSRDGRRPCFALNRRGSINRPHCPRTRTESWAMNEYRGPFKIRHSGRAQLGSRNGHATLRFSVVYQARGTISPSQADSERLGILIIAPVCGTIRG